MRISSRQPRLTLSSTPHHIQQALLHRHLVCHLAVARCLPPRDCDMGLLSLRRTRSAIFPFQLASLSRLYSSSTASLMPSALHALATRLCINMIMGTSPISVRARVTAVVSARGGQTHREGSRLASRRLSVPYPDTRRPALLGYTTGLRFGNNGRAINTRDAFSGCPRGARAQQVRAHTAGDGRHGHADSERAKALHLVTYCVDLISTDLYERDA